MAEKNLTCDLCGMDIGGEPVVQEIGGKNLNFCCQGCAHAYQQAHDADLLAEVQPSDVAKSKTPKLNFELKNDDTAYFSINGMWCAGCAVAAENVLKNQAGVKSVDISFAAERGRVNFDPKAVDIGAALGKIRQIGLSSACCKRCEPTKQR